MCIRVIRWIGITGWIAFGLTGCGDHNNFFGSLADDHSIQAKIQDGQTALDRGDCQGAIDNFTDVYNHDPNDVKSRINLAAAYMCRTGFSVTEFIAIAADMATSGSGVTSQNVFKNVASNAVTVLNADWPADTDTAINLLTPYQTDTDVAFNLAIYEMIRAVMTVADILNLVNGVVDCAANQGSSDFTNCGMTAQNVTDIVNALQDSSNLLTSVGLTPDVTNTVNTIFTDMNSASTGDPISCADLQQYLINQGVDPTAQLACI